MLLSDSTDFRWIREDSAMRFLSAVHEHGLRSASGWRDVAFPGISQSAIAQKTGLSRPTVSTLAARGRKLLLNRSTELGAAIDPKKAGVAVGVDFSYGHNRVALADVHGQIYQPRKPGDYEISVDQSTEADWSLSWAAEGIKMLLNEAGLELSDVKTIGVALAG